MALDDAADAAEVKFRRGKKTEAGRIHAHRAERVRRPRHIRATHGSEPCPHAVAVNAVGPDVPDNAKRQQQHGALTQNDERSVALHGTGELAKAV